MLKESKHYRSAQPEILGHSPTFLGSLRVQVLLLGKAATVLMGAFEQGVNQHVQADKVQLQNVRWNPKKHALTMCKRIPGLTLRNYPECLFIFMATWSLDVGVPILWELTPFE